MTTTTAATTTVWPIFLQQLRLKTSRTHTHINAHSPEQPALHMNRQKQKKQAT